MPLVLSNARENTLNLEGLKRLSNMVNAIFSNGTLTEGKLNKELSRKKIDIETLKALFKEHSAKPYTLKTMEAYCSYTLKVKDDKRATKRNHKIKREATPRLYKLHALLND